MLEPMKYTAELIKGKTYEIGGTTFVFGKPGKPIPKGVSPEYLRGTGHFKISKAGGPSGEDVKDEDTQGVPGTKGLEPQKENKGAGIKEFKDTATKDTATKDKITKVETKGETKGTTKSTKDKIVPKILLD